MSEERGWRVAAPELEQSAIISARSILIDRRAIATELQGPAYCQPRLIPSSSQPMAKSARRLSRAP
jgi:hypothetical protein